MRAIPGLVPNVSGGYVPLPGAPSEASPSDLGGGETAPPVPSRTPSPSAARDEETSDPKRLWVGRAHELGAAMANARRRSIDAAEDDDDAARRRAEKAASSSGVGKGLGAAAVRGLAALDGAVDVHGDAKPAVVFVSGSGGVAGDTLRYLRMLAAAGHLALCPDDFCGWPARLRSREPRTVDADSPSDYWAVNLLYGDAPATGELVYESCAEQYTSSDRLSLVYDNTLKVKHAALTKVLIDLPEAMAKRGIYLAGNSEGAIVLGMMDDEVLDPTSAARRMSGSGVGGGTLSPGRRGDRGSGMRLGGESEWEAKLLGRINIAYSLEPNYFTYRTIAKIVKAESMTQTATKTEADEDEEEATVRLAPPERDTTPEPTTRGGVEVVASEAQCISHDAPRGLFGSRWRRDVPTLCINGSMDQFFGRRNSVSETVVKRASDSLLRKGDRPHITGDAGHRMAELGMTRAFVAQMEGAKHAMCSTHDFALRELLADFLRQPEACAGIPERWEKDERLEAMMLWHSVVTPNQCSFASMASTEQTIALLGAAAPRDPRRADPIPAVPSFLDLTSSLARLVRGASVPGSPARDLSGTPSESPVLGPSRRISDAGRRVSFDVIRSAAASANANQAGIGAGTGTGVRPGSVSQPDFRRYAGGDDSSNSGRGYRRGGAAQDGGLLVAAHAAAARRSARSEGAEDSSARSAASTASAVSREEETTTTAAATMTATAATTSSATNTAATNAARRYAFGFLGLDRLAARASRAAHSFALRVDKTVKFGFGSSGVQRLYRTKSAEAMEPAPTAREGRVERRRDDGDATRREDAAGEKIAAVEPVAVDANGAKRRGWRMTSWLFSFSKSRAPRGARSGSS